MATQPVSKIYLFLIMLVGIIGGYLFYSTWLKPAEPVTPPPAISNSDDLKTFQNLKINFGILDDQAYKTFNISGEVPVNAGVTGKRDIFAP